MQHEINFDLQKGTREHFKIELDQSITYAEIYRVLKTKDRWIRVQPRRFKGSKTDIDISIITRGLWGGFHRGKIRVFSSTSDTEYVINLFVHPKKANPILLEL
jgi:hypothetical protein